MFKIGEFAGIFDVSIRALRLYDRMGLLKPGYTDENTGYRYYTPDQVQVLNAILELKGVGFNLKEIKDLIKKDMDCELLMKQLNEKQAYWRNSIVIARHRISAIEDVKRQIKHSNNTKIKLKIVETPNGRAYRLAKLVCLAGARADSQLSEALWV